MTTLWELNFFLSRKLSLFQWIRIASCESWEMNSFYFTSSLLMLYNFYLWKLVKVKPDVACACTSLVPRNARFRTTLLSQKCKVALNHLADLFRLHERLDLNMLISVLLIINGLHWILTSHKPMRILNVTSNPTLARAATGVRSVKTAVDRMPRPNKFLPPNLRANIPPGSCVMM